MTNDMLEVSSRDDMLLVLPQHQLRILLGSEVACHPCACNPCMHSDGQQSYHFAPLHTQGMSSRCCESISPTQKLSAKVVVR